MKDLLSLIGTYAAIMFLLAIFPPSRAFAGRGMLFSGMIFLLILWGWIAALAYNFMGVIGAILAVVLTPAIMGPVVIIHEAIHGNWFAVLGIVGGVVGVVILGMIGSMLSLGDS